MVNEGSFFLFVLVFPEKNVAEFQKPLHFFRGPFFSNHSIDGSKFLLVFMYDDLFMNIAQEYLVMDGAGLVSTVGGFLGLFLGSSCVSIIDWFASKTKRYII